MPTPTLLPYALPSKVEELQTQLSEIAKKYKVDLKGTPFLNHSQAQWSWWSGSDGDFVNYDKKLFWHPYTPEVFVCLSGF